MFNFIKKNKHTGRITRKLVYMYEPSSLNNHSKEFKEERKGKKKFKELGEIFKYLFTNQI